MKIAQLLSILGILAFGTDVAAADPPGNLRSRRCTSCWPQAVLL